MTPEELKLLQQEQSAWKSQQTQAPVDMQSGMDANTLQQIQQEQAGFKTSTGQPAPATTGDQPQEQGFLDRLWNGNNEFDYPELTEGYGEAQAARQGSGYNPRPSNIERAFTAQRMPRTMLGKMQAIKSEVPDAEFDTDKNGNVTVKIDGKQFYLNRSGISTQDASDILIDTVFDAAGSIIGGKVGGKVLGKIGAILGVGIGAAGGSLTRDVAAAFSGADYRTTTEGGLSNIEDAGKNAVISGVFGAGAEAIVPLLRPVFNRLIGNVTDMTFYNASKGEFTDKGKAVLKKLGIEPSTVSKEFVDEYRSLVKQGKIPMEAAKVAEAQTLPTPVDLTRGDVTRDPVLQSQEKATQAGAFGNKGTQVEIQQFRGTQQDQLWNSAGGLQQQIGGGIRNVDDPGQGMLQARNTIVQEYDRVKGLGNKLYRMTREAGDLGFDPDYIRLGAKNMKTALDNEWLPSNAGPVYDKVNEIGQWTTKNAGKDVPLRQLVIWRKDFGDLVDGMTGEAKMAAGRMINEIDGMIDGAIQQGLWRGDRRALTMLRRANTVWRVMKDRYEADDIVSQIIERDAKGQFVKTPQQAVNAIWGVDSLVGKSGTANIINKLKGLMPESDFNLLKEEAFLRLLGTQFKGNTKDEWLRHLMSGDKLQSAIEKSIRENPDMFRAMFKSNEIAAMRAFGRTVQNATSMHHLAGNPSKTSYGNRMMSIIFNTPGIGPIARGIVGYFESAPVRASMRSPFSPPSEIPSGIAGTAGAVYGSQTGQMPSEDGNVNDSRLREFDDLWGRIQQYMQYDDRKSSMSGGSGSDTVAGGGGDDRLDVDSPNSVSMTIEDRAEFAASLSYGLEKQRASRAAIQQLQAMEQVGHPTRSGSVASKILNPASPVDQAIGAVLPRMKQFESGGDPNAKNPHSTASGTYQFIDSTWRNMVKKYGSKYGLSGSYTNAQIMKLKSNPQLQEAMAVEYARENASYLQQKGHPVTPATIYSAHLLGPGGANQFLSSAARAPNTIAANIFGSGSSVVRYNKLIFYDRQGPRTVRQVMSFLQSKMG